MGTEYTRQSTYTDGDTITAAHTNDEFDRLLSVFDATNGHTHDGTSAEGGPITKLLGSDLFFGAGTASSDITIAFNTSGNDGELKWLQSDNRFQFSNDIIVVDDKQLIFGTNTDVAVSYDETTTNSLKIAATEGAGLAITLMADEGDDAGDEWKLNIADGGTLTLGNDINSAGTYVTHLTITPNSTVANSTMAVAGNVTVGGNIDVDGTTNLDAVDIDGAVQIDSTITVGANDQGYDVILYGDTASANMTWDTSADDLILNGAAGLVVPDGQLTLGSVALTFKDEDDLSSNSASSIASQQSIKAYVDSQVTAQDLDVTSDSGTIDIDLDSETLTIAGGTGLSSSASSTTVTLAVDAAQTGITSIYATDLILGEDSQTAIDFGTTNEIDFKVDNAARLTLSSSALYPVTNNQIDLGTASLEFKNAFFDGTVTADAFAGPLTGNVTGTADVATAATTVTVSDNESTNENNVILFGAGAAGSGNIGVEADGNMTYNPSTGKITATGFIGALTGDVTGNVAGNLTGTVATATQNSITTATGLTSTGALNSGSITSGFGAIDNGSDTITTTGVITGGTLEATTDTAAGDNAAIGYTSVLGLILTGQGSTNDVTINNDADAEVMGIATGTTVANFASVPTVADVAIKVAGKESIWIPAAAMYPSTTNPCSDLTQVETTALRPDLKVLDFAADADDFAQFSIAFPKSWNEGTITYQPFWTVTAGTNTGTVVWQLGGIAVTSDATINTAFGTLIATSALAHSGTSNDLMVSAESGAVTIAGSPSTDDVCFFQINNDTSASGQTGVVRLLGVKIFFTTNAANDA